MRDLSDYDDKKLPEGIFITVSKCSETGDRYLTFRAPTSENKNAYCFLSFESDGKVQRHVVPNLPALDKGEVGLSLKEWDSVIDILLELGKGKK